LSESDPQERANLRAQVDGPSYLGPSTFGKLPLATEPEDLDRLRPDVVILGAPWDGGVTTRPGQRFAPRSIRAAAYECGGRHPVLEVAPFDALRIVDYGDVACVPNLAAEAHQGIRGRVGEIARRGMVPVTMGGDHSVTYPCVAAVAEAWAPRRLGIVQFDAHPDTADDSWGNRRSHGTPIRRLIEDGLVRGEDVVQMGLRGYWPPESTFAWMRERGVRWHLMEELLRRGTAAVVEDVIAEALDGPDAVYLTVDVDVLDPAFAPGTGAPEPGGMTSADLLLAIRAVALRTTVVGMDVVEVCPPFDSAEVTAHLANRCIMETLSGLAVKAGAERQVGSGRATSRRFTDGRAR
jgi:agmatinase